MKKSLTEIEISQVSRPKSQLFLCICYRTYFPRKKENNMVVIVKEAVIIAFGLFHDNAIHGM